VDSYRPFLRSPQPDSLIYTGSFTYAPNYEAMAWFVGEALPLVQTAVPSATLTITGNPGERPLPPAKHVQHVGFVDDVRPLVAGSWISLAPLQTGGGTRLKILEAMALKTAVVATSKGAEGLDAADGVHLLIADSPQAFAEATITLLQDAELRQRLAENASHFVNEQYDWTAVSPKLLSLIDEITDATR
jgi:glycosyltransferase involved in cell wall biosynthesis